MILRSSYTQSVFSVYPIYTEDIIERYLIKNVNISDGRVYDIEKDTIYTIYIQDIPCRDTLSSKEKTIYIKNKLDAIELKPRFKYYIIYLQYKCSNYVNYKYEYKRNYRK